MRMIVTLAAILSAISLTTAWSMSMLPRAHDTAIHTAGSGSLLPKPILPLLR